jgi:hypothetical protein
MDFTQWGVAALICITALVSTKLDCVPWSTQATLEDDRLAVSISLKSRFRRQRRDLRKDAKKGN